LDNLFSDIRPLHLYNDRSPIAHVGAMHLGQ